VVLRGAAMSNYSEAELRDLYDQYKRLPYPQSADFLYAVRNGHIIFDKNPPTDEQKFEEFKKAITK
jgi:hypothetical protein